MFKLNAAARLVADSAVIAPSDSYKSENESDLHDQQHERETSTEPESDSSSTTSEASSTTVSIGDEPDPADAQYALKANLRILADRLNTESDPLTMDMENACTAADTVDESSLPGAEGFDMTGQEGNTNYMNVEGEVLADADPTLFDTANQPMG